MKWDFSSIFVSLFIILEGELCLKVSLKKTKLVNHYFSVDIKPFVSGLEPLKKSIFKYEKLESAGVTNEVIKHCAANKSMFFWLYRNFCDYLCPISEYAHLVYSGPVTKALVLFLNHTTHVPMSGPLHVLFPLPGKFQEMHTTCPFAYFRPLLINVTFLEHFIYNIGLLSFLTFFISLTLLYFSP